MTSWPTERLARLVKHEAISYGIVQPGHYVDGGIPMVRVKDLENGVIAASSPFRTSRAIEEKHSKTRLSGGEVLISLVGTVGRTSSVPPTLAGWNVARAIAVLRPEKTSAEWLRIALQSAPVQAHIESVLNTTVQATLNLKDLGNLPIPLPPTREQEAIAEVLGALDDKIAANQKRVRVADELARVTFRNSLGDAEIPLSETAEFVNGKAFTKNASGTGRVVVRIAELNNGIGGSTVRNDIDVDDKHVARPGDLLFAWSGSLTLKRWHLDEAIVNQHIFKVLPRPRYPMWLVNQLIALKLDEFIAIAADKATTMGHIQRKHLDEPVRIPDGPVIARLDELISSLWETALKAEIENENLARTRDFLLPQLMSGKLRVNDAEKLISDAGY